MDDYFYYQEEGRRFRFFAIPKVLLTHPYYAGLCCEAKFLYGLLLDRVALSKKNGWKDEFGRIFVYYSIKNIMKDLNCAHGKAEKLLAELEEYGLVERKRQGAGRPSILYPIPF